GHSAEVGVKNSLTAMGGPKLAWTFKDAGSGCGTPAVVGDKAYLLGSRKDKGKDADFVIALDLKAGKELWATPIGPSYAYPNQWNFGPTSCPSVEEGRLYALSSNGQLACVETAKGKIEWSIDLIKTLGAQVTDAGSGPAMVPDPNGGPGKVKGQ